MNLSRLPFLTSATCTFSPSTATSSAHGTSMSSILFSALSASSIHLSNKLCGFLAPGEDVLTILYGLLILWRDAANVNCCRAFVAGDINGLTISSDLRTFGAGLPSESGSDLLGGSGSRSILPGGKLGMHMFFIAVLLNLFVVQSMFFICF